MSCLFYRHGAEVPAEDAPPVPGGYAVRVWRPAPGEQLPRGLRAKAYVAFRRFPRLGIFANGDYGVLTIYDGDRLVHRSGLFPRYFRFPFMGKDDLQIGDTWTDPEYRGRGLATLAIRAALTECRRPGRKFWYLVEEDNVPSIRAAEKAGFRKVGAGNRTKRFGLSALGQYVMER